MLLCLGNKKLGHEEILSPAFLLRKPSHSQSFTFDLCFKVCSFQFPNPDDYYKHLTIFQGDYVCLKKGVLFPLLIFCLLLLLLGRTESKQIQGGEGH